MADPEADGDSHAKNGGNNAEDVDQVSERAVQVPTEQRRQSRADRQRHVARIGVIGETQASQDIDAPGVHPVMQEGWWHFQ